MRRSSECPIGWTVDIVNCHGSGRMSGVVVAHPGPYSLRIRGVSRDVIAPMSLVVGEARPTVSAPPQPVPDAEPSAHRPPPPPRPSPASAPAPLPTWTQGTLDL